jgi:hypothetical protein
MLLRLGAGKVIVTFMIYLPFLLAGFVVAAAFFTTLATVYPAMNTDIHHVNLPAPIIETLPPEG